MRSGPILRDSLNHCTVIEPQPAAKLSTRFEGFVKVGHAVISMYDLQTWNSSKQLDPHWMGCGLVDRFNFLAETATLRRLFTSITM